MVEGTVEGALSYEVGDEFRGATELRLAADGAYDCVPPARRPRAS